MHGAILSVIFVFNFTDGTQAVQHLQHQFTGPTAIEYCQNSQIRLNARNKLNATTGDDTIVIHAECYRD
jgi:hypothetical protein